MKIAVASTRSFYKKTLPILIPSLFDAGFSSNDINIFIGGYHENGKKRMYDIDCYLLDNNTFEITALIGIIENNLYSPYWFLLHDTCKVGKQFKEKINNIPENQPEKIAIRTCPSMSIGAYKGEYLTNNKQLILSTKNTDYSQEGIYKCKKWHVENEDFLLWKVEPQPHIYPNHGEPQIIENDDWYNSGTNRRTEYYPHVDMYKNKSNWGQTPIDRMVVSI